MNQRRYFNERAEQWDTLMPTVELDRAARLVAALPIPRGGAVLDVGSGTGVILPFLAQAVGGEGQVVAVDCAEVMLMVGRRKHRAHTAAACDIQYAPFRPDLFDTVVCFNCFPHFQDKVRALSEMRRLLKPDGAIVVCHSQSREGINALHTEVGGEVREDRIPADEVVRTQFLDAGLGDVSIDNRPDSYLALGWKRAR